MKKTLLTIALAVIVTILGASQVVNASVGTCSGHDGVNCSAGADSDGSVICNDGWTDSSVQYDEMEEICEYVEIGNNVLDDAEVDATESIDACENYFDKISDTPTRYQDMDYYFYGDDIACRLIESEMDYLYNVASMLLSLSKEAIDEGEFDYADSVLIAAEKYTDAYSETNSFYYLPCLEKLACPSNAHKVPDGTLLIDGACACDTGYAFNTDGSKCVELDSSNNTLSDIAGHTNEEAIQYLFEAGVISGYPDGTFKPENTVNRAELLKILVGGKGVTPQIADYKNCFPDVEEDWFAPYVCYAKEQGWVQGYEDGTFKPAQEVNKVEAIKMLVKSQNYAVFETGLENIYEDVSSSDWFAPFVKVAKEKGLLEETGTKLLPAEPMSRAGISENIYRVMIIVAQGLDSFATEYEPIVAEIETPEVVPDEPIISELTTMSISAFWKNWDADAEDDGFELGPYFKDIDGEMVYPEVNDWTVEVQLYEAETDYSKYGNFDTYKIGNVLYTFEYAQDEVKYESYINLPYVRVAVEDIPQITKDKDYIWIDATFSSPTQGTFSASRDYTGNFFGI